MDELRADDPRQVGGYTLLARLGSGGMGDVYLGRSLSGRQVAVKVIRADLAGDPTFRARFAREVAAARRVSGAFTAPVIDADPDAPVPWLATDYVPGPSLGDAVARHGVLPPAAVLTLAARLAEGLAAVHAAGVIHRDLKPANVLLAEDGPRLIDFGISQAADFAQVTSPTSVLGTPGFIAPELVQGRPVGPSSDVFTMGAVLAYAATGEYPFGTGPADARTLRVLFMAPDLGKVPAGLRPLLERCLAKEPAERPTAGEFLAELVAACPDAADERDDWLPAGILAEIRRRPLPQETANSRRGIPVPSPAAAPAPAGGAWRRPWRWRPRTRVNRRLGAAGAVAAVAALGTVIGLLAAPSGHPAALAGQADGPASAAPTASPAAPTTSPAAPALPAPTGLSVVAATQTSVTLSWKAPPGGGRPSEYEISENGTGLVSIPGYQTKYEVTGLDANTAYRFSVVAVTSGGLPTLAADVATATADMPPLAETVFDGPVHSQVTFSSDSTWQDVGATWDDQWLISADCGRPACAVILNGSVDGMTFTATLTRSGTTFTGAAPINNYWQDCLNAGSYEDSTLTIKLAATQEEVRADSFTVSAFTGTMTWNVPAPPDGCGGSLYQMRVTGTS